MNKETFNIPNNGEVVESDWTNFQLVGGNEKGEREYKNNAILVKKSEVKNANTDYKRTRTIGRIALFSSKDKLAA